MYVRDVGGDVRGVHAASGAALAVGHLHEPPQGSPPPTLMELHAANLAVSEQLTVGHHLGFGFEVGLFWFSLMSTYGADQSLALPLRQLLPRLVIGVEDGVCLLETGLKPGAWMCRSIDSERC